MAAKLKNYHFKNIINGNGKQTIYDIAHLRLKQMMKDYYPEYMDNKTEDKIRSKFPIQLKKERMRSNPYWK